MAPKNGGKGGHTGKPVTGLAKWRQCMAGDRPWEKDILFDTLHWIRQIVAVVFATLWGVLGVTGAVPFVVFLAIALGSGIAFYRSLRIDEDDFGGHTPLVQEGMGPAVSMFMVLWICVYSTIHF